MFAHFIAECLFDALNVVFMFNNHQVTLSNYSEFGTVTFLSQSIYFHFEK